MKKEHLSAPKYLCIFMYLMYFCNWLFLVFLLFMIVTDFCFCSTFYHYPLSMICRSNLKKYVDSHIKQKKQNEKKLNKYKKRIIPNWVPGNFGHLTIMKFLMYRKNLNIYIYDINYKIYNKNKYKICKMNIKYIYLI